MVQLKALLFVCGVYSAMAHPIPLAPDLHKVSVVHVLIHVRFSNSWNIEIDDRLCSETGRMGVAAPGRLEYRPKREQMHSTEGENKDPTDCETE